MFNNSNKYSRLYQAINNLLCNNYPTFVRFACVWLKGSVKSRPFAVSRWTYKNQQNSVNVPQHFRTRTRNMSSRHLSTGDDLPPKVEGKLRLYSMEYCPYAHRTKLVLRAKNVDHDIVNINLINKPKWLFDIHPEGKVPALDTGSKIVTESLTISDFLDQEYPNPPLYSAEPLAREQDKALIEKIGPLIEVFTKIILEKEKKAAEEWKKEFLPHLEYFEKELAKKGTKYFGGESPGMVDYMLWPWAERAGTVALTLKERLPFDSEEFPALRAWRKTLRTHPVVDGIYHGPEKFYKCIQIKSGTLPPDYDSI